MTTFQVVWYLGFVAILCVIGINAIVSTRKEEAAAEKESMIPDLSDAEVTRDNHLVKTLDGRLIRMKGLKKGETEAVELQTVTANGVAVGQPEIRYGITTDDDWFKVENEVLGLPGFN